MTEELSSLSNELNADGRNDALYAINEMSYARSFLPIYQRYQLEPSFLIQFPVILPFSLPLRENFCLTYKLEEKDGYTLHFSSVTSQREARAGMTGDSPPTIPVRNTRVEMIYIVEDPAVELNSEVLSEYFDLLLGQVNTVITGYLIQTKDFRVYPISREMLDFATIYRTIPVNSWSETAMGIFILHMELPATLETLDEETHARIARLSHLISIGANPFVLSEEFTLSARRYAARGSYREAVVASQTSVETFLSSLLARMLVEEGNTPEEIETHLESPFLSRVKKLFHPRLGGAWNIENTNSTVGAWYWATYLLRNRVVHAGYRPSLQETKASLEAAEAFRGYAMDLVRLKASEYPALQQYFA